MRKAASDRDSDQLDENDGRRESRTDDHKRVPDHLAETVACGAVLCGHLNGSQAIAAEVTS